MIGALFHYISRPPGVTTFDSKTGVFQPMKANFGLLPELDAPPRDKRKRHAAYAERALTDLEMALRTISE